MFCLINSVRFSTNQTSILLDLESWNLEFVLFLDRKPRNQQRSISTPKALWPYLQPCGRSKRRRPQRKMRCVSSDGPSEEKTQETSSLKLMRLSQFLRIFFCQQKKTPEVFERWSFRWRESWVVGLEWWMDWFGEWCDAVEAFWWVYGLEEVTRRCGEFS